MTNQRLPEWYVNRLFYTILVVIYQMFSYYRPHPYKWVFFYYLSTFNLAFTHSGGCIRETGWMAEWIFLFICHHYYSL